MSSFLFYSTYSNVPNFLVVPLLTSTSSVDRYLVYLDGGVFVPLLLASYWCLVLLQQLGNGALCLGFPLPGAATTRVFNSQGPPLPESITPRVHHYIRYLNISPSYPFPITSRRIKLHEHGKYIL